MNENSADQLSPELQIDNGWLALKPSNWQEMAEIEIDRIRWRPGQMPNNIDIHVDEVNRLLASLGISEKVEITRFDQKVDASARIRNINVDGSATASQIVSASEQKGSKLRFVEDKIVIAIDFDKLLNQAEYQKEQFAQLVEQEFQKQITELILKEVIERLKIDMINLTAFIVSIVATLDMLDPMVERQNAGWFSPLDTAAMLGTFAICIGGMNIVSKVITSVYYINQKIKNDPEYLKKIQRKFLEKSKDRSVIDPKAIGIEIHVEEWVAEFLKMPFADSIKKTEALFSQKLRELFGSVEYFRASESKS